VKKLGFLLVVVMCSLGGCNSHKELTESSAKDMLQERLDQEPNRANFTIDGLTKKLFKPTTIDYRGAPASKDDAPGLIHRFIDAGFVTQQSFGRDYVDFSGNYEGDVIYPTLTHHLLMTLYMRQGSSQIRGQVVSTVKDRQSVFAITSGNALPDGSISLTFVFRPPLYYGPYIYKLSTANGQAILNGPEPAQENRAASLVNSKPLNAAKITVPMYSYAMTSKAPVKVVGESDQVSLGKIVVTNVDSLLLETETMATANFKWKIDLNEIGDVIAQSKPQGKVGEVRFQKQPDGTWVITGINM
jgi:hypothetical protein